MELLSMKSFAKQMNNLTFTDYYYRLMLLARSVFKWENLPDNIDERWIEKFLFVDGKCVIYDDPEKGLMVAKCNLVGDLNSYEEPRKVMPIGSDYRGDPLIVGEDCALIRNNDEMIPTSFFLKLFAYRLAETSRTIDVNVNAQKTPVLVVGSEKQKLTLKNVYVQFTGNEPAIFGDKSLDTDMLTVLRTDAPIVFPQLQTQKQDIWNECLTFLGINNANTEKRERLITDEVEANNTHIDLSADCFLKTREDGAKIANSIFKKEITVSRRAQKEVIECTQDTQLSSET